MTDISNDKQTSVDSKYDNEHTDTHNDNNVITNSDNYDGHIYLDKVMWRTVKDITNSNKQQPPRLILIGNKMTTSLKKNLQPC